MSKCAGKLDEIVYCSSRVGRTRAHHCVQAFKIALGGLSSDWFTIDVLEVRYFAEIKWHLAEDFPFAGHRDAAIRILKRDGQFLRFVDEIDLRVTLRLCPLFSHTIDVPFTAEY